MKKFIVIFFLCSFSVIALSQTSSTDKHADSLRTILRSTSNDTTRMVTLYEFGNYYIESDRDSALILFEQAMIIAKKLDQPLLQAFVLMSRSYVIMHQGNLPLSFKLVNEAKVILEDEKNEKNAYIVAENEFASNPNKYRLSLLAIAFHYLGNLYSQAKENEKAIAYYKAEIGLFEMLQSKKGLVTSNMNIGSIYLDMDNLDSAYFYSNRALENSIVSNWRVYQGSIMEDIGRNFFKRNQPDSAKYYYWLSLKVNTEQNNVASQILVCISLARLYQSMQQTDSMMYYSRVALQKANGLKMPSGISASAALVSAAYQLQNKPDSALTYLLISKKTSDSLNTDRNEKLSQFQNVSFDEQMQLEKTAQENIASKNKIRTIALLAGVGLLLLLVIIFYHNNRQKKKVNATLEKTLVDLKATQSQLIQSEKMASLGELTAGIAHEIQNPLNFVNNFSEVNKELADELETELATGNLRSAKEIVSDIKLNSEKINHHGKRADSIVKGMLQHSRSGSGQKEPADINTLLDECLRLSFHGMRAKDKSFNAKTETSFDTGLSTVNIISQEIGRVFLNLFTNAFYSVLQKKNQLGENYNPVVSAATSKEGNRIKIIIKDNGNGIPQNVIDKIFQPFFTTKPTGEGTGLGLSMSYDIITKGHGGELKVNTQEGEFAEFIILLPAKS